MCVDCRDVNTGTVVAVGPVGPTGPSGNNGSSAFVYVAYADDAIGTGFTNTFNISKDYIAVRSTTTAIAAPIAADFAGLWKNYKGTTGTAGTNGTNGTTGATGVSAFTSLTANATSPSANRYTLQVGTTDWMTVGQMTYITNSGYYKVETITNSTRVVVEDVLYPGNTPAALLTGVKVSPAGLRGATGATGATGTSGLIYETTDGGGGAAIANGPYQFLMRKADNTGYTWINIMELKELLNNI